MTLKRLFLSLSVILALLVGGGWYYLLHTESGARQVWRIAASATGGALRAGRVSGSLATAVSIEGAQFVSDAVVIDIARLRAAANVQLVPLAVTISDATVNGLRVVLPNDEASSDVTDIPALLSSLQLPLELIVAGLVVENIAVAGAGDELQIASTRLRGRWSDEILIERFEATSDGLTAGLDGRLALYAPFELELEANTEIAPTLSGLASPLAVAVAADGTLENLALDITVRDPAVTLSGRVTSLTVDPVVDLVAETTGIQWPLRPAEPAVSLSGARVALAGGLERYRLEATADVLVAGMSEFSAAVDGTGTLSTFTADRVSATREGGSIRGQAELAWGDSPTVRAGLELATIRLAEWIDAWVGDHRVDGNLELALAPESLELRNSSLVVVSGENRIDIDGEVAVVGAPDSWSVLADIGVGTPRFPAGRFTIEGAGDRDGIEIPTLAGELLGGSLTGSAEYGWRDDLRWSATLELAGIETGELVADWPAIINGRFVASGQRRSGDWLVELDRIEGALRNYPFSAGGAIGMTGEDLFANRLAVRHGDSHLRLDGNLRGEDGVTYSANITALHNYVDDLRGNLRMSGAVALGGERPFLRVDANSDEIVYGGYRVANVVVRDLATDNDLFNVELATGAASVNGFAVRGIRIATGATRDRQVLDAFVDLGEASIALAAAGQVDNWQAPATFKGQLDRLTFESAEISAALTEPAALDVGSSGGGIDELCLEGEGELAFCLGARWAPSQGIDAALDLVALPVALVNDFYETRFRFDQVVTGNLAWRQPLSGNISGNAELRLSAGTIVNTERPEEPVATDPGRLTFEVVDGELLVGAVDLPIPGLGRVDGKFDLLDVTAGRDSEVRGTLNVDLPDIGSVDSMLPLVDDASGRLQARMQLSGTGNAPALTGDIDIDDGGLTFLPVGLRLDEIDLTTHLYESGEVEMTGAFRAGEGRAEIRTRADFTQTDTTGIEVRIRGDNLALIDVPDVRAVANADVGIALDNNVLTIDGKVTIPEARISPRSIGVSKISESDDVIIVAGELPHADTPAANPRDLQLLGALQVDFGNDVDVVLDVASARLTGSTVFTWTGDLLPMANGRYDISGNIQAFGQRLMITEGGVRFPNVPASDPLLRIMAIREIFGNSEVKEAGILVDGSAQRPTIETFTVPLTTEERALTLLLTGSDFNYEQGVGAVDFGTYIAPKVYASYGIGLFDRENVVRVRYDLARGFGVTATSGQIDSGVDLTYRFEN